MSNLTDDLMSQLGSGGIAQIAAALGTDQAQTQGAIGSALPALLAGLANNAKKPEGAQSLSSALDKHSPSIFDQLGSVIQSGGGADGNAILGHVLGQKRGGVEQQLAGQTGLDAGAIAKLLPMLAPLVLGFLSKQKQEKSLDPGALGSMLGEERRATEAASPGLGGLASILDADGDGSVMDDLIDLTKGKGAAKGGLGGLLDKVLGRSK